MVALYVYNFDNIFVLLTDSCIGACRDVKNTHICAPLLIKVDAIQKSISTQILNSKTQEYIALNSAVELLSTNTMLLSKLKISSW